MRYLLASIFVLSLLAGTLPAQAQSSPKLAFNQAANLFIDGDNEQALRSVNNALKRYPDDAQLQALKQKLEEQQEQEQQQQQQDGDGDPGDEQPQDEQQPQDGEEGEEGENGEGDEQQEQEGQEGEGEESEGEDQPQEGEEGENSEEQDGGDLDTEKRLQEMNISPEKARMLLEAMKSNEVQYLQQKKRKQNTRSNSGRPDW